VKTVLLSTSSRTGSNSLKATTYLKKVLSEKAINASVVSFEQCDIPMVGRGSINTDNLTEFQRNLIDQWAAAQLVVFVVPEYNWITSGELVNALHQLGEEDFAHLFDNKVFAFVGVSSGRGGRRPCLEIGVTVNKLISFLDKTSVVSPKLFESHETGRNLDEAGQSLGNTIYEKGMADFVDYTLRVAERWHRG
jgi:chromate reductase